MGYLPTNTLSRVVRTSSTRSSTTLHSIAEEKIIEVVHDRERSAAKYITGMSCSFV